MKNQHVSILRKTGSVLLAALLIALVSVCLTLATFADALDPTPAGTLSEISFAGESGIIYHSNVATYAKAYDGKSQIDPAHIQLTVVGQTAQKKPTDVSAYFVTPAKTERQSDVGEAKICVTYKWEGVLKKEYLSARINRRVLSFGDFSLALSMTYDPTPTKTAYQYALSAEELALASEKALSGVVPSDAGKVTLVSVEKVNVSVDDFNRALNEGTPLQKHLKATLGGDRMMNYALADLDVTVKAAPIQITEVIWKSAGKDVKDVLEFSYGDENSRLITAAGKLGDGTFLDLIVKIKGTDLTLQLADDAAWGAVREEAYVLEAFSSDPVHYALTGAEELEVSFQKAVCEIKVKDAVFAGDAEHEPSFYPLAIVGAGDKTPHDVLSRIQYTYTLDGKTFVDAPSAPGKYTVHIALDAADAKNYTLKVTEVGEKTDGVITVTLLPYRLTAGIGEGNADVLLFSEKGTLENVSLTLTAAEPAPALLKGFTVYKAFCVRVAGVKKGDSFRMVIPVHSDLLSDPGTKPLSDTDLYLLEGDGKCAAKDRYRVSLEENGAYYLVEGIASENDNEITLSMMIAPTYNVSFWATVPGVALIIFLVLLAILALALIGLMLRRMEKRVINPKLTIDTEGDVPKVEPVTAPDKLGDADACIDENLSAKEAALYEEVAPERTEAPDVGGEAAEMAAEMVADTVAEAAQIDLSDHRDAQAIEEIDRMTAAMAEERAAELFETVGAEEDTVPSDDKDLTAAIDETIGEAVGEDDGAVDVFASMEEDEATAAAVGDTIDSIVADALASFVEIPDGLLGKNFDERASREVSRDIAQMANASVGEAIRVITADGAELKWREGVAKADLEKSIFDAAKQYTPAEWAESYTREVIDAVVAALEKALFD